MNTPAHLIIAAAALSHPDKPKSLWAAILGGLAPDVSLYVLGGVSLFILGIEAQIVFDELYFSDAWQRVFAIDNSFFVWGALAGICWWRGWRTGLIFANAALIHLVLDFLLHHDDARAHFWPFSDWVFQSPVSYWDPAHYGGIVTVGEVILVLILCAVLWRRFVPDPDRPIWMPNCRWLFLALAVMQLAPVVMFAVMF